MRTTLDIDEKLLNDILTITGEKLKSKAVTKVLEEFRRRKAIESLLGLEGSDGISDDWDIWRRTNLGKPREFSSDDHTF